MGLESRFLLSLPNRCEHWSYSRENDLVHSQPPVKWWGWDSNSGTSDPTAVTLSEQQPPVWDDGDSRFYQTGQALYSSLYSSCEHCQEGRNQLLVLDLVAHDLSSSVILEVTLSSKLQGYGEE